jgi:hypothetical protein
MIPERIHAIKTMTYDTQQIITYFRREDPNYNPSHVVDVIAYIEEWIIEDFGSLTGVILQDENGNEL